MSTETTRLGRTESEPVHTFKPGTAQAQGLDRLERVLVINDDPGIRGLMISALSLAGFSVDVAADLSQALERIASTPPDVIVLDAELPGSDGFGIPELLRRRALDVPVLFLAAAPFSVLEVTARVQALMRPVPNVPSLTDEDVLRCGDLTVNHLRHEVRLGGELVELSPTEYRLLHCLITHQERVLSKAQILEAVWQYDFGGESLVVERFVSNLRRKLNNDRNPILHTVRGIGYRLGSQAR